MLMKTTQNIQQRWGRAKDIPWPKAWSPEPFKNIHCERPQCRIISENRAWIQIRKLNLLQIDVIKLTKHAILTIGESTKNSIKGFYVDSPGTSL